jgi:trimeric autotransporter adhesin
MRKGPSTPRLYLLALSGVLLLPSRSAGLVPLDEDNRKAGLTALVAGGFGSEELEVQPSLEVEPRGSSKALGHPALQRFFAFQSDAWEVRWDTRSDRPNLIQGAGIPLLPGKGNRLKLAHEGGPDLKEVETRVRAFLADFPELLNVSGFDLRLDPASTVNVGEEKQIWLVELQQFHHGISVEGAKVFFRVNNGNIVQLGTERIAEVRTSATPRIDRAAALATAVQALGFRVEDLGEVVDPGTLKFVPALTAGEHPAETYEGARGQGYRHYLVWEVEFRRAGDPATWQAKVDARTGRLLSLVDGNDYATAQVTGGIYPVTNSDPEVVRSLPFINVTNGSAKVADASGEYSYSGGLAMTNLSGKYIKIADQCGPVSKSDREPGNIMLGTSGGTDCATPGAGGAGNTHAARTGYYHLTSINRKAAAYLPGNAWLNGALTANMNIKSTCNAFWNGSTVNFYQSGAGCSNTGEIAAVFLHEWGHGLDQNTGGAAPDKGTGEAVGDTFAFLETRDACIGRNFKPGVTCHNCDSDCTGVRDLAAFANGGSHTVARPGTVATPTGLDCGRIRCPYNVFISPYQGPMGYEGHCESYIASTANWDLTQSLVARWGDDGWARMEALWYKSLTPSKSAYQVVSGGKCNPKAKVDGCGSSNWYTVFLAADDDDGDLSNGTPNGCRIWDAFKAHGIACGARPACTQ